MRKNFLALFIAIATVCFTSCQYGQGLKVCSTDYPALKTLYPGEFDYALAQTWWLPDNPYADYSCNIRLLNGELYLESKATETTSFVAQFDNGYFVGLDLGEFDGWVKYYPYYSNLLEELPDTIVSVDNCKGIVKVGSQLGYVLTSCFSGTTPEQSSGTVYKLTCEEGLWKWQDTISLSGAPLAYFVTEDLMIYIVTTRNIVCFSQDQQLHTIVESDLIAAIGANSIVYMDQTIYCGSPMGVYSYSISSQTETWYPINYQSLKK